MKPLYLYSSRDSFFHRLDARTKIVFLACYIPLIFVLDFPWFLPLIPLGILWFLAGISPKEFYPVFYVLTPLLVAVTIIHVLFDPCPCWYVGPIRLSQAGLWTGLAIGFRLWAMATGFMLFAMTTDPMRWGLGLVPWGLPYKAAFLFGFGMRIFPLLQEEFGVVQNALRARANDLLNSRNPFKIMWGGWVCVMPLALGALRRSNDVSLAMELRGLNYASEMGVERVVYEQPRLQTADYVVMTVSILLALIAIIFFRDFHPFAVAG
jgi:energy-coupling factor transport system permease protein